MSALGDLISDIGAAAGDEGKNTVESLTKNPELQSRLDLSLGDYDKTRAASQVSLDQYIKDYIAGTKTATARNQQEQGVIDRYYNGDVERKLAEMRAQRAQAGQMALQRGLDYARRGQNLDQLTRGGGPSSYDRALSMRTGADLNLQTLLDNLNQERSDYNYLNQNQMGLIGQRTALADALAARGLVPAQAQKAELGWNMGALNDLLKLDQLNKFYGVKYNPSGSEMAGNIVGDVGNIAAGIYTGGLSSMADGLGGGGGSQTRGPNTQWNLWNGWQPTTSTATSSYIPSMTTAGMMPAGGWSLPSAGYGSYFGAPPTPTFPALGSMYSAIGGGGWGGF